MAKVENWFKEHKTRVVVVSFAEPDRLIHYQKQQKWPFVLLADPQREAYHYFGLKRLSLFRAFNVRTLKRYWKLLRQGAKIRNYGKVDVYQAGGDFIIDRTGKVVYEFRSDDPADRPTVDELKQARMGVSP